jgi:urea transport system permease protein
MSVFMQQFANGVNLAALLLIAALGLVIIFGLMNVINMAHGELIMIGAYATYFANTVLDLPFWVAMIIAFLVSAAVGILIEVIIIKRLYSKPTETLLATFALSIIFVQLVQLIFSPENKYVAMPIKGILKVGTVSIPNYNLFIIAVALSILAMTGVLLLKTKFGKKMRAVTQNRQMVECLGIATSKVDTWTFAYGAGLAGLAGAVIAPINSVSPTMGGAYLTDSFMTVVVGGVQSIIGTALGSGIVGESRTILAGFSNEVFAKILVFLIIIVIIRFKPEGLFARERR